MMHECRLAMASSIYKTMLKDPMILLYFEYGSFLINGGALAQPYEANTGVLKVFRSIPGVKIG